MKKVFIRFISCGLLIALTLFAGLGEGVLSSPVLFAESAAPHTKTISPYPDEDGNYTVTIEVAPPEITTRDVIIVFESSYGMSSQHAGYGESLETAKEVAKSLVDSLVSGGVPTRIGLVAFSDVVAASIPPTDDVTTIKNTIDMQVAAGASNVQMGLHEARTLLSGSSAAIKLVIPILDGAPNESYDITSYPSQSDIHPLYYYLSDLFDDGKTRLFIGHGPRHLWVGKRFLPEDRMNYSAIVRNSEISSTLTQTQTRPYINSEGQVKSAWVVPEYQMEAEAALLRQDQTSISLITLMKNADKQNMYGDKEVDILSEYLSPSVFVQLDANKDIPELRNHVADFGQSTLLFENVEVKDVIDAEHFELVENSVTMDGGEVGVATFDVSDNQTIHWQLGAVSDKATLSYKLRPKSSAMPQLGELPTSISAYVSSSSSLKNLPATTIQLKTVSYVGRNGDNYVVSVPTHSNITLQSPDGIGMSYPNIRFMGWNDGTQLLQPNSSLLIQENLVLTGVWESPTIPDTTYPLKDDDSYSEYNPIPIKDEPDKKETDKKETGKKETQKEKTGPQKEELVTITPNSTMGGRVLGEAVRAPRGTSFGVIAKRFPVQPNVGYIFSGWYLNNTKITDDFTFDVDTTLTAVFEKLPPPNTEDGYAEYNPTEYETIADSGMVFGALNYDAHHAYLQGYPSGDIRPNAFVSREETCAIFYRLLDPKFRAKLLVEQNKFSDVTGDKNWSNKHISTLANAGIVTGYRDGTFRPYNNITRGELAVLISKFDALSPKTSTSFSDMEKHWSEHYVGNAVAKGWIKGYPSGEYMPDKYITRAELSTIVNKVLGRTIHPSNYSRHLNLRAFSDTDTNSWWGDDITIATNSYVSNETQNNKQVWEKIIHPILEM